MRKIVNTILEIMNEMEVIKMSISERTITSVEIQKRLNDKGIKAPKATTKKAVKKVVEKLYIISNIKNGTQKEVKLKGLEASINHININNKLGKTTKQIVHEIDKGEKFININRIWELKTNQMTNELKELKKWKHTKFHNGQKTQY